MTSLAGEELAVQVRRSDGSLGRSPPSHVAAPSQVRPTSSSRLNLLPLRHDHQPPSRDEYARDQERPASDSDRSTQFPGDWAATQWPAVPPAPDLLAAQPGHVHSNVPNHFGPSFVGPPQRSFQTAAPPRFSPEAPSGRCSRHIDDPVFAAQCGPVWRLLPSSRAEPRYIQDLILPPLPPPLPLCSLGYTRHAPAQFGPTAFMSSDCAGALSRDFMRSEPTPFGQCAPVPRRSLCGSQRAVPFCDVPDGYGDAYQAERLRAGAQLMAPTWPSLEPPGCLDSGVWRSNSGAAYTLPQLEGHHMPERYGAFAPQAAFAAAQYSPFGNHWQHWPPRVASADVMGYVGVLGARGHTRSLDCVRPQQRAPATEDHVAPRKDNRRRADSVPVVLPATRPRLRPDCQSVETLSLRSNSGSPRQVQPETRTLSAERPPKPAKSASQAYDLLSMLEVYQT